MVDYYGLPAEGEGGWPGRHEASHRFPSTEMKARMVEGALADAVAARMGSSFDRGRFVPYVMMHEFEAMLFSDCSGFSLAVGRPDLSGEFERIYAEFKSPEDINDSRETAPSKRVLRLLPSYNKPLMGNLGVLHIGLAKIREECPHVNEWLRRLEERGGR